MIDQWRTLTPFDDFWVGGFRHSPTGQCTVAIMMDGESGGFSAVVEGVGETWEEAIECLEETLSQALAGARSALGLKSKTEGGATE